MSNSQNNKNEQQNNLCTTLTEQWKKGELERGWYYVLCEDEVEMLEWEGDYFLSGDVPLIGDGDACIKEVLAPVPSYEEWQQLKELLWACQDELYSHLDSGAEAMADAITNAIGEKK